MATNDEPCGIALIVEETTRVWDQDCGGEKKFFNFLSMVVELQQLHGRKHYFCIVRIWTFRTYLRL